MTYGPKVFEVFTWRHFLNGIRTEIYEKLWSVSRTYRTGHIVGVVAKSVVTTWTALLRHVGTEALRMYLLPYMSFNTLTFMYEHIMAQDAFGTLSQHETRIPAMRTAPVVQMLMKMLRDPGHNKNMRCFIWHTSSFEM